MLWLLGGNCSSGCSSLGSLLLLLVLLLPVFAGCRSSCQIRILVIRDLGTGGRCDIATWNQVPLGAELAVADILTNRLEELFLLLDSRHLAHSTRTLSHHQTGYHHSQHTTTGLDALPKLLGQLHPTLLRFEHSRAE